MFAFFSVIAAAVLSFVLGTAWYGTLSGAWIRVSGVPVNENGQPQNGANPMLYVAGFIMQLVVAGMMYHVFATAGVDGIFAGLVAGLGVGLLFITPWIALNNAYSGRPVLLTVIDGGYATLGCAAMGLVLGLF
ncbi:MAG: DUF1761 domain-containing protein [Rhodobacteraceae bacterium]|nr:DUF1761 domain-containing protein [Paracoccaceae bacterium]